MKKTNIYLIIIVLFMSSSAISQKYKGILVFKDSTSIEGLAKLKSSGEIVFRKSKKDKKVKYSFDSLQYAKLYDPDGIHKYYQIKVKGVPTPKILQLVQEGKVTLYKLNTTGMNTMNMGAGAGGGFGAPMPMTYHYSIDDYYVIKEGEKEVTHLGSTNLFSKNFKKAASDYFSDCPVLVEKIQQKEYKKKDIEAVIRFYNNNCR